MRVTCSVMNFMLMFLFCSLDVSDKKNDSVQTSKALKLVQFQINIVRCGLWRYKPEMHI